MTGVGKFGSMFLAQANQFPGVHIVGIAYPLGSVGDIPNLMRPDFVGSVLEKLGLVEVISCLTKGGKEIAQDIHKEVWVTIEAYDDCLKNCFEE